MRKLCFGLSFVAMVVFTACGGDNGSSADDVGESSSSSEVDMIESCASGETPSSGSEKAGSDTSEDASSSESGDLSSCSSEESSSSESEVFSSSSEEESSSSEESESSSSDESSSSSEEESSSSALSSSSDASIYNASANSLTDLRDGQVYRTTTIDIPSKIYSEVWMAENLSFETEKSWCGGGSETTEGDCSVYGRLYTWAAAVAKPEDECGYGHECSLGTGDIRGACPKGWHVPSQSEWNELFTAVGGPSTAGAKLKSSTGWNSSGNGTDNYLFSALPAGYRYNDGGFYDGGYYDGGNGANFWSSAAEDYGDYAYYMGLYYDIDNAGLGVDTKNYGFSVRCLKD